MHRIIDKIFVVFLLVVSLAFGYTLGRKAEALDPGGFKVSSKEDVVGLADPRPVIKHELRKGPLDFIIPYMDPFVVPFVLNKYVVVGMLCLWLFYRIYARRKYNWYPPPKAQRAPPGYPSRPPGRRAGSVKP